ncbi:MAG: DUF3352 domain-containing protein [Coleofasciculaceae cyanobacterium SM2_1_6]|nr:DUF3352 domain-containing protein [Coleofasciculaceae cyanobacterium SM2_1_6]
MKQRLVSALVAIVFVACMGLLAGCGGSSLGATKNLPPQGVMFVSKQSPLVVSLLTGLNQLWNQPAAGAAIKSFLNKQNLDYKKDLEPWLGEEITLAITDLDFDHNLQNGVQPGYLLVATTKDGAVSREFLQTWLSQKLITGTELSFIPYKGTEIISPQVEDINSLGDSLESSGMNSGVNLGAGTVASTVVGDRFVLIANHPQVLRQAINNAQAIALSLTEAADYQATLGKLDQPRLGLSFVNLPALSAWLGKHGELAQEPPFSSLAIALSQKDGGLMATTALKTAPKTSLETSLISPDSTPSVGVASPTENRIPTFHFPSPLDNYLPSTSGLVVSGHNLGEFLEQILTPPDKTQETGETLLVTQLENLLSRLDSQLHLNLGTDLLPWVTGDYALSWLPPGDGGGAKALAKVKSKAESKAESKVSFREDAAMTGNWLFVAEKSDPLAKEAIAHLDQLALESGFSITPLKIAEQPVTLWTQLQSQKTAQGLQSVDTLVRGVHTTVQQTLDDTQKDYEIFASSIAAMGAALGVGSQPLPTATGFQAALAPFADPNQGYIYLDWLTVRPLLEAQFPLLRLIEVPLSPLLEKLETMSFTSYGSSEGITTSELFLKLQS